MGDPATTGTAVDYSVVATLPDQEVADRYLAWLTGGHVQAVMAGGASRAAVLRHEEPGVIRIESRYRFPSRSGFDRYEQRHAPALREDGRRQFGEVAGVSFARTIAMVEHEEGGTA